MSLRSLTVNETTFPLDAHTCHAERQRSICFEHGEKADSSAEFILSVTKGLRMTLGGLVQFI
jgi:hypothetical protein